MIKRSKIFGKLSHLELGSGVWAIELPLLDKDVDLFCLDLSLLRYDLVEAITVQTSNKLTSKWSYKAELAKSEISSIHNASIILNLNDLDALLYFLLHHHRDGLTPVNHIDLEMNCEAGGDCTLVVLTNKFSPPMSGEEAKKLLGIE